MAGERVTSLTRLLARRVRARPSEPADFVRCERFVRDWLGSYAAGAAAPAGRILAAGPARVRDLDARVFLAAALSHVTETDDLHRASVTHPACVVIPTAWLLARQRGLDAGRFLHAVIVGYEVMTRVGEALGPGHYRLHHTTATAGVFGAAAAAADLLELDEDGWVWALGSAGTQAAGLWQFNEEAAMSKPLHAGHAAAAGLRAALLAKAGLTAAESILEGGKGVFRALCPDPDPEAVLADAPTWKIEETSIKPYPCCRHVHAAIDAALAVRPRLDPDALPRSVRVLAYPAALDVTDRPRPGTPHEARFSLQYAVATTLAAGRPGMAAFEPPALADARAGALLERITIGVDPDLAAAYPQRWGAVLEVGRADGTTLVERCSSASGDPERPLGDADLDAKVLDLLGWAGLGTRAARALLERCRRLPAGGPLFPLPRPGPGQPFSES
jgi:2-methylcitrate dehydratase PrpD